MPDPASMFKIECPCCKGKGYVVVWDSAWPDTEAVSYNVNWCTHCMGKKEIESEIPPPFSASVEK